MLTNASPLLTDRRCETFDDIFGAEKVTEDTEESARRLRAKLYVLLFECLADAGKWGEGLEATAQSLRVLPASCHKDLWDFRIQFMGKNGKDTSGEMLKVKESGAEMVAKVWTTLAQATNNKQKQLSAYQKAVESLEAVPLAQVRSLAHGPPYARLVKRSLSCVAALSSHGPVVEDFSSLEGHDSTRTPHGGAYALPTTRTPRRLILRGGLVWRCFKSCLTPPTRPLRQVEYLILYGEFLYSSGFPVEDAKNQLIAAADILLELDTALVDEENASHAGGSEADTRSQLSASHAPSVKTVRTVATSKQGSRMGSKAGSVRGGHAGHLSQTLNVAHLQLLARIYIMLAKMAEGRNEVVKSLLVSHHYLVRAVAMSCAGVTKRANEKLVKISEEGDGALASPPPGGERVVYDVPSTPEGWIGYELPEALCDACMADKEMDVLSPRTISKPELLATYLEWAIGALQTHGLQLECLPVLAVYGFVAKHLIRSESLSALSKLWTAQFYADMGLWTEAQSLRELVGPSLTLSSAQEREFEQQIRQMDLMRTASGQAKDTSRPNPFIKVGTRRTATR